MVTVITNKNFNVFEIRNENKSGFIAKKKEELSDFEAFFLKAMGDAIRPTNTGWYWINGAYCWQTFDYDANGYRRGVIEHRVWLTQNGIAMYETLDNNKLYRVQPVW